MGRASHVSLRFTIHEPTNRLLATRPARDRDCEVIAAAGHRLPLVVVRNSSYRAPLQLAALLFFI
jgi:hypothetical protein